MYAQIKAKCACTNQDKRRMHNDNIDNIKKEINYKKQKTKTNKKTNKQANKQKARGIMTVLLIMMSIRAE